MSLYSKTKQLYWLLSKPSVYIIDSVFKPNLNRKIKSVRFFVSNIIPNWVSRSLYLFNLINIDITKIFYEMHNF